MNTKKLSDKLSICEQIEPGDIAKIADMGFRSIICNRPDGEAESQPTFDQIRTVAETLEIEVRYIPVVIDSISDQDASDFLSAVNELPGPTLAYCRSGMRSSKLWSLSQGEKSTLSVLVTGVKNASSALKNTLQQSATSSNSESGGDKR